MNGREKSDLVIVAMKPANKAGRPAAEPVEPRAGAEGNAGRQSTHRAQYRVERDTGAGPRTVSRLNSASPSYTQGGSRIRESRSYGSVRGGAQ